MPASAQPSYDIFISYRVADSPVEARLLYTDLANRFGTEAVFLDKKRLHAGMDWPDELENKLRQAKVLLVLIKDEARWLGVKRLGGRRMDEAQDWVRLEIEKCLADGQTTIIPVLVDAAMLPPPDDLPETVRGLLRKQGAKRTIKYFPVDLIGQHIQWMGFIQYLFQTRSEQFSVGFFETIIFCLHKFAGFLILSSYFRQFIPRIL